METLLKVEDLRTVFATPEGTVRAVDGVSFAIRPGETVALLGESGCGKSITALSLLRLVPEPAGRIVGGQVWLGGTDLLRLPAAAMRDIRGGRLAMIFQEPQSSLNPVMTIGEQIAEAVTASSLTHGPRLGPIGEAVKAQSVHPCTAPLASVPSATASFLPDRAARRRRVIELLEAVGIADPARCLDEYPHQLSGGMKQRVMIATALAAEPQLLIADEPTTALDVTIQAQILDLLKKLQRRSGMAILLITHDLGVVAGMADRVAVMYAGEIVEEAPRAEFFRRPSHPYSQKLFRSLPGRLKRGAELEVMRGTVPSLARSFAGCRFAERCDFAWERCREEPPRWIMADNHGVRCHLRETPERRDEVARPIRSAAEIPASGEGAAAATPLLEVGDLKVHFPIHRGVLQRVAGQVKAVDGVSFAIPDGHTLALVGESGCGKTTVGKGVLGLLRPTAGSVVFEGRELTTLRHRDLRPLRRHMQIIFQDPYASLDPRMLVGEIIEEGMRAQGLGGDKRARAEQVGRLLEQVGLPRAAARRYPHEFSGGQRQRISIARSLGVQPKLIVCDEPTSALDVSVQAQILNLLKRLQQQFRLSYLFITHNISVVEYLAHEVAVMYLGRIVERGPVHEVLDDPRHPYTQALLAAVPRIEEAAARPVVRLAGDIPSPSSPPPGCHFHPRCPQARAECRDRYPPATRIGAAHEVCCHLYSSEK